MTNDWTGNYIDGAWVDGGAELIEVENPATGQRIGSVPRSGPAEVDAAAGAAAAAFPSWAGTPLDDRVAMLDAVAALLIDRKAELADLVTAELGMPRKLSERIQLGLPITTFASMRSVVRDVEWSARLRNSHILRTPIGVVGAITPWNFPLHQIAAKIAPALAAGCTVVLKPSEVAPLNAFALFEILDEVGFPPGVVNLVSGFGTEVGEPLAAHPAVDMVSFTGSSAAGRRVSEVAAVTVKRVALELGGKSAAVVAPGAELATAVRDVVGNCMLNSGQACNALTRLLVPRQELAESEQIAAALITRFHPGDPTDTAVRMGPLVSARQLARVREYVEDALTEGARLVVGGPTSGDLPPNGYFFPATILSDVKSDMSIAREEVFGPVLSLMPYDDLDEAVMIANDTDYGLAAAVWAADLEQGLALGARMRAGQVQVNGGPHNPLAPFGGFRQSGNGREFGTFGLEEFLEVTALQLPLEATVGS